MRHLYRSDGIVMKNTLLIGLLGLSCCAQAADWQYGAYLDLGYANALNSEDTLNWRSKATTQRLNQFAPNMGMAYVRKLADASSRWGVELAAQAGYDTDGQVPASDRLPGYSILRYIARANVSYLAPIGNGLTLTAGLMNSFIGYESIFSKDNPNYTRSWIADYSPYYLLGVGGQYAVNPDLNVGLYLVSDYDYLAYRSPQPKYAGQISWNLSPQWKLTQNLFAGPEQANAQTQYWRYFSDSIVQWSDDDLSLGLAYDVGTEKRANTGKQSLWMGSALFSRWHIDGPWSVALRPEVYWDGDAQLTGSQQLIKAVTATLEYKIPLDLVTATLRSEYRYDDSTGKQGGFYPHRNALQTLDNGQHLWLISCLLSFDKP